MALVGEPELSMFLSSHQSSASLMEWTSRTMDSSNDLCSSSYISTSDPYPSHEYYGRPLTFSNLSSQTPFGMGENYHTMKMEPLNSSDDFGFYGPIPQINTQVTYHGSGAGGSFIPQHQVAHPYSTQPPVQQQQLHVGNGGTFEEIDGMVKNFNDVSPQQHQPDLEMESLLGFSDLVSLHHPQTSGPQQHSIYASHGSSLGSLGLPGLDAHPVVSHQHTRNLWDDSMHPSQQAVLMREYQEPIMFDNSSMDMSQSVGSDTSTMTFASPSDSLNSNFFDVGRGHVVSPTKLAVSGSLKVGSPSVQHQQMALKQPQMVLKKPQHSSLRMSPPGLGGGYPQQEQNLYVRQTASSSFVPSSSPAPLSLHQFQNSPLPSHLNHLTEQMSTGTSVPATGLQLVHYLLACAEAVAENKLKDAEVILVRLRNHVLADGNPMQRLAAYFEQALTSRLSKESVSPKRSSVEVDKSLPQAEELEAFSVYYDCIPIGKFGHLTCNQILLDAVERENNIHVLDLNIFHGMQWPAFLQALALRGGEVPKLRLSALGSDLKELKETGSKLAECARNLKVPFEFCPIESPLEDFNAGLVETRRGEALVVNSHVQFHRILNKGPNALNMLLGDLRRLNPIVMAFAENDGNHNSNNFLTRFVECLRYYSALFDAFDASLPPDSPARMRMEEIFAAQKIKNIIACEGPGRVSGHETMKSWHKKMESAHFRCVNLSTRAVSQAHLLLNLYYSNGYTLNTSDCGYLALGWHGMPLMGISAWQ